MSALSPWYAVHRSHTRLDPENRLVDFAIAGESVSPYTICSGMRYEQLASVQLLVLALAGFVLAAAVGLVLAAIAVLVGLAITLVGPVG